MLQRREGLAHRLGADLGEERLQREDARRERIAVVLDDMVKLFRKILAFIRGYNLRRPRPPYHHQTTGSL